MTKNILTGSSGAVGQKLAELLTAKGEQVVRWDRSRVPPTDSSAMAAFLDEVKPDVLYHLATDATPTGLENESWRVNVEWTETLAHLCAERNIRFAFTSSVMVFSDNAKGPFTLLSVPDAAEGYGYEKYQAEQRVLAAYPGAVIARIGWQIGDAAGSNNMVDFCESQMKEQGKISASTRWYPACSFLADTVQMLHRLVHTSQGLYLVDSNTAWTFFEIIYALNKLHGERWIVEPNEAFVYDQRMLDFRCGIPALDSRLPALPPKRV